MSAVIYDEVEIEDLDFDEENGVFTYPCPCGDKFTINLDQIKEGEEIAKCPSCSLTIKIIYDKESCEKFDEKRKEYLKSFGLVY